MLRLKRLPPDSRPKKLVQWEDNPSAGQLFWRSIEYAVVRQLEILPKTRSEVLAHGQDMGVVANFGYHFFQPLILCTILGTHAPTLAYRFFAQTPNDNDQIVDRLLVAGISFMAWGMTLCYRPYRHYLQQVRLDTLIGHGNHIRRNWAYAYEWPSSWDLRQVVLGRVAQRVKLHLGGGKFSDTQVAGHKYPTLAR